MSPINASDEYLNWFVYDAPLFTFVGDWALYLMGGEL